MSLSQQPVISGSEPLISVIIAVYNGAEFISKAISSVKGQSHQNIELIVVDDGSTDNTVELVQQESDPRIKLIEIEHQGVSAARNAGLRVMNGEYFTWLDADDLFTPNSLSARLKIFKKEPDTAIVDGLVKITNDKMDKMISIWSPSFRGDPLSKYLMADPSAYFGASVMIRNEKGKEYQFKEGMSHCEDLLFLTELAATGVNYNYTGENVLINRRNVNTAMSHLENLEKGYLTFIREVRKLTLRNKAPTLSMKCHFASIMFKSYAKERKLTKAFRVPFKFLLV